MEKQAILHLTSMKCLLITLLFFFSCDFSGTVPSERKDVKAEISKLEDSNEMNIEGRFAPPEGFLRMKVGTESYAGYLRNLTLYPVGKNVALYNGQLKGNQTAQAAVIKMDVGKQNLQQCADAVMRLRAEYLYKEKRFEELHFNFTNGFNAKYSTWRSGKGISVKGNKVNWVNASSNNSSYASFRTYLNKVFMYAGTASLEKELKPKELADIGPGDVFIKGGHPGHAVIVVDVAYDGKGDKVFMLAQSYMPAQEIHVLKNPINLSISPWYKLSEISSIIETPEWTFDSNQLRTFE